MLSASHLCKLRTPYIRHGAVRKEGLMDAFLGWEAELGKKTEEDKNKRGYCNVSIPAHTNIGLESM